MERVLTPSPPAASAGQSIAVIGTGNRGRGLTAVLTAVAVLGAASCGLRDGDGPFDPPEEPVLWMYAPGMVSDDS
jgi:hypothetical protein